MPHVVEAYAAHRKFELPSWFKLLLAGLVDLLVGKLAMFWGEFGIVKVRKCAGIEFSESEIN